MKQTTPQKIEKVIFEMTTAFNKWNERVKAGMMPIPIQDLDYWKQQLQYAYNDLVDESDQDMHDRLQSETEQRAELQELEAQGRD